MRPRTLHQPRLVARLAEPWLHRPAAPTRLVLEITRRCNLRCEMCRTWELPAKHELTPEELGRVLRQLPRLAWLDVTGGEPFRRQDAEEVLLAIAASTPSLLVLHFPTNGWFTARTVQAVERLRAARPELELIVTVSLDGPPAVHDAIRGREGSAQRALETFVALRAMPGVHTYVGTTLTARAQGSLDELERWLCARVPGFSPREWHWNWVQVSEHFFKNGHLTAERGLAAAAARGLVRKHIRRRGFPRNLVDVMELLFLVNLEGYQRGEPVGIHCQALHSSAFLSPEGELYPCHVWDRPLGNVLQTPVAQLWSAGETLRAREEIERLACGGCFTPCEAYPTLSGSPLRTVTQSARRALRLLRERD